MAALDLLKLSISLNIKGTSQLARAGLNPLTSPIAIKAPSISLGTDALPAAVGGANQLVSGVFVIPNGSSLSIDLNAFTDTFLRTSQSIVRAKSYFFWLLSAADAPGVGNACAGVSIGPHGTNGHPLNLTGTTPAFTLLNGEYQLIGSRVAAGRAVDGTHKVILVSNADTVDGKLLVCIPGGTA